MFDYITVDKWYDVCDMKFPHVGVVDYVPAINVKHNQIKDYFQWTRDTGQRSVMVSNHGVRTFKKCGNIPEEVVHIFAKNSIINRPRVSAIPVGIAESFCNHGNLDILESERLKPQHIDNLMLCCFSEKTNRSRVGLKDKFRNLSWCTCLGKMRFSTYVQLVHSHLFVLSPRGSGIDCHRTWESLYLGAIPIVEDNPLYDHFDDLPIVRVKSYDYIDESLLIENLHLINNTSWNWDKITFKYWDSMIQGHKSGLYHS